jgi:hypothetical protein
MSLLALPEGELRHLASYLGSQIVKQGIENRDTMLQLFKTGVKKSTKGKKLTREKKGEADSGDEGDGEDEDRNVDSRIQTRNHLPIEVSVSPFSVYHNQCPSVPSCLIALVQKILSEIHLDRRPFRRNADCLSGAWL